MGDGTKVRKDSELLTVLSLFGSGIAVFYLAWRAEKLSANAESISASNKNAKKKGF